MTIVLDALAQGHTSRAHVQLTCPPAHLESRGTASGDSSFLGQDFTYVHAEFCNVGFFFQPIMGPLRWQPGPQRYQMWSSNVVLLAWCHLTPNERALYCLLQIEVVNRTSPMRDPCCTPLYPASRDLLITTS